MEPEGSSVPMHAALQSLGENSLKLGCSLNPQDVHLRHIRSLYVCPNHTTVTVASIPKQVQGGHLRCYSYLRRLWGTAHRGHPSLLLASYCSSILLSWC